MKTKVIFIGLCVLVVLVQWYVPYGMIRAREEVLEKGKAFRFRTAPVDPADPFRGKYLSLRFEDNAIVIAKNEKWERGETVYAMLQIDSAGFAKISSVSRWEPLNSGDYLKTCVDYVTFFREHLLTLEFPFDRFYLDEHKAPEAETFYDQAQRDSTQVSFALVKLYKGHAVLEDVIVSGISLREGKIPKQKK